MNASQTPTILVIPKDFSIDSPVALSREGSITKISSESPKRLIIKTSPLKLREKFPRQNSPLKAFMKDRDLSPIIGPVTPTLYTEPSKNQSPIRTRLRLISTSSIQKSRPISSQVKGYDHSISQTMITGKEDRPGTASTGQLFASKYSASFTLKERLRSSILDNTLKEKQTLKKSESEKVFEKIDDIILNCQKLNKEVSKVERKVTRGQGNFMKDLLRIHNKSQKTSGKFDFWKKDKEFLENRSKLKLELHKLRLEAKGPDDSKSKDSLKIWESAMERTTVKDEPSETFLIENIMTMESRAAKPKKTPTIDERYTQFVTNMQQRQREQQEESPWIMSVEGDTNEMTTLNLNLTKEASKRETETEANLSPISSPNKTRRKSKIALKRIFTESLKSPDPIRALEVSLKKPIPQIKTEGQDFLELLHTNSRDSSNSKSRSNSPNKLQLANEKISRKQKYVLHQIHMIQTRDFNLNYEMDFSNFKKRGLSRGKSQPIATSTKQNASKV